VADLHLIWFYMDDTAPTADKVDVRAWADELGLPDGQLSRANTTSAFIASCEVSTTYVDADGHVRTVAGRQVARREEFITVSVLRDDGKTLAQVKYFNARKGRTGIVANTHVVKTIVRSGLDAIEAAAAREWLAANEEQFRIEQGQVPWYIVRRLVRVAIEEAAVPVLRRKATFFAYEDDLDQVRAAGTFLRRTVATSEFIDLPIEDGADVSLFAASADAHLCGQVRHLLSLVEGFAAGNSPIRNPPAVKVAGWSPQYEALVSAHARHERRLRTRLTQTGLALPSLHQALTRLVPSIRLPTVTTR
jgi:hypothetical protein